jgi:hypothetical protein
MHRHAAWLLGLTFLGGLALPSAHAQTRGVVELFTSQGCSSCPPADRLLADLARDPSIVAMSLPIDYWDYLGWKDTLASPDNSARQRAYARMRKDREVYTPQAVVNGKVHVAGGDEPAITQAMAKTRADGATLSVALKIVVTAENMNVLIPAATGRPAGEIWLCPLVSAVPVTIERGENRGHTVTYHNVVRRWVRLGDWNGEPRSISVPKAGLIAEGADRAAVIVQAGTGENPRTIFGAAVASIR